MKKNILSFIAALSLGIAVNAQTFEIYDGASSTTNILGTILESTIMGDEYEAHLFIKNVSGPATNTFIRRVNILKTSPEVTYEICYGIYDPSDPTAIGACFTSVDSIYTTPHYLTLDASNKASIDVGVRYDAVYEPVHFRYYVEDDAGTIYDSLDIKVHNSLAVKELKTNVSFNSFPNPANDVINLTVQGSTDNSLKMIDVLGNVLVEEKFGTSKKVDVSQFKNGVYILTVYANGKMIQTKRVVVRH